MPLGRKRGDVLTEVAFEVEGFPPLKNQAISMFSTRHGHASSVVLLLEAAQRAIANRSFHPFTGPIGLEVVLRAPEGVVRGDTTNYLGGIGDTLQEKSHLTIPLDHLGDLANVALYRDDKQIREVHWYQEQRAPPSYRLRLWSLEHGTGGRSDRLG